MTKARAPISFDNALTRIAALLGWPAMAAAVDRKERTVRNWSDPDTGETCPVDCALKLDLLFQAGGGEGAPMFETYSLLLETGHAEQFGCQRELAKKLHVAIKEGAEAHSAILSVTLPGADAADRANAKREVEEGIAALKATLPLLNDGAGPDASGEGQPRGGAST